MACQASAANGPPRENATWHSMSWGWPAAPAGVGFRTRAGRQRSPKTAPGSALPSPGPGTAIPVCQVLPMMSSYPDGSSVLP